MQITVSCVGGVYISVSNEQSGGTSTESGWGAGVGRGGVTIATVWSPAVTAKEKMGAMSEETT